MLASLHAHDVSLLQQAGHEFVTWQIWHDAAHDADYQKLQYKRDADSHTESELVALRDLTARLITHTRLDAVHSSSCAYDQMLVQTARQR